MTLTPETITELGTLVASIAALCTAFSGAFVKIIEALGKYKSISSNKTNPPDDENKT